MMDTTTTTTTTGLDYSYEVDEKINPWAVEQLEDFLFFCCPECPDRSSTKAIFINHALMEHPNVRHLHWLGYSNISGGGNCECIYDRKLTKLTKIGKKNHIWWLKLPLL
jgi:hypothetical protein